MSIPGIQRQVFDAMYCGIHMVPAIKIIMLISQRLSKHGLSSFLEKGN